jgi:hypothetical protein
MKLKVQLYNEYKNTKDIIQMQKPCRYEINQVSTTLPLKCDTSQVTVQDVRACTD